MRPTKPRREGLESGQLAGRRQILGGALALGLAVPWAERAAADDDPTKARPQAGDVLVYMKGERKGEVVAAEDVPLGGPQVLAYPMDPATNTVRKASRLNQVALVRFDPAELTEETRTNAADGVVVYSAICTHQACPVSFWKKEKQTLFCSCHGSQFDPKDAAKKLSGPAPRRLAMLPVKMENGVLTVAGEFIGKLGSKKKA